MVVLGSHGDLFGYRTLWLPHRRLVGDRSLPFSLNLVRRTYLSLQLPMQPCGAVFRRMSLERVLG